MRRFHTLSTHSTTPAPTNATTANQSHPHYTSLSHFRLFSYFVVEFSADVAVIVVMPAPPRAILGPGVKTPLDDNVDVFTVSTRVFEELNAFVYADLFVKQFGRLASLVETLKFVVMKHDKLTALLSMGSEKQSDLCASSTSSSSSSSTKFSSSSAPTATSALHCAADSLEQLDGQLEKTWKRVRWLNKIVKCIRQKSAISASTNNFTVSLRPTKLVKRRPSLPPMSRLKQMERWTLSSSPGSPAASPFFSRRREDLKDGAGEKPKDVQRKKTC